MREQEVDGRGVPSDQRLVGRLGVVAEVDRAEQATEQMRVALAGQQLQRRAYVRVAAAAIGAAPVPVMSGGVTVQADPDVHVEPVEQVEERPVQADAVGLHGRLDPCTGDSSPYRCHRFFEEAGSGQQWLTAVQYQFDGIQLVRRDMLGDSLSGLGDRAA